MLAVASTRIVNTGLPVGGATGSTQVGLSRTSNTMNSAAAIIAIVPNHRPRGIGPGRRSAYHVSSAAALTASASQSEDAIRGSKVGKDTLHVLNAFKTPI